MALTTTNDPSAASDSPQNLIVGESAGHKETLIPFPEVIPVSSFIPSLLLGVNIVDKNSIPKRSPSLAKKVPNRK